MRIALMLALGASVAVPESGEAASVQATLAATVNVVSSCQITKTTAMSFPTVTSSGSTPDIAIADGSMTYECTGVAPKLSANDNQNNLRFKLHRPTGYFIYYSICAVETGNGGVCTRIDNEDKTSFPLSGSGTQVLRGTIDRTVANGFQVGGYTDSIVLTLTF